MLSDNAEKNLMPLKKQLLLRALVLLFALPLANSFGLRMLYEYNINGNIAYRNIDSVVSGIISFTEIAVVFCGFGLFLRAYYEYKWKPAGFILALNVASALVTYISGAAILFLVTGNPALNLPFIFIYTALNFTADLVILGVLSATAAVTSKAAHKNGLVSKTALFKRGCIWSAVIFGVAGLIQNAVQTAFDISGYGAPASFNDYVYLITPYLRLAVYTMLGAFIAWLAGTLGLNKAEAEQGPGTAQNGNESARL